MTQIWADGPTPTNTLGELTSQTDAKAQTSTMTYDKLGRMTKRIEPEGATTWQYDTKANGIGKLASVTIHPWATKNSTATTP